MFKGLFILSMVVFIFSTPAVAAVKPYHGEKAKIVVAVWPSLDKAYAELLPGFNKIYPNIEVVIKSQGYGDHHNWLKSTIAAGKGAPDVAAVEVGQMGSLAVGGGFENLLPEPFNGGRYRKDIVAYKWSQALISETNLSAIPVDQAPGCIYYRKDVFDECSLKIEDIKTMEDLFEAGKKVMWIMNKNRRKDHWFLSHAEHIYMMIAFTRPNPYFDRNGRPDVNSPVMRAAFQWTKKFRDAGLDAKVNEWSPEWYTLLKTGSVAYFPSGAWMTGQMADWIAPKEIGKFRVAREVSLLNDSPPMAMSWGGSFLAIPKQSANKAAAWEFIKYVCLNKGSQLANYRSIQAFPTLLSAMEDREFQKPVYYLGGQYATKLWVEIAKSIPDVFLTEYDNLAATIVSAALKRYLDGGQSLDRVLGDAQKELEEKLKSSY